MSTPTANPGGPRARSFGAGRLAWRPFAFPGGVRAGQNRAVVAAGSENPAVLRPGSSGHCPAGRRGGRVLPWPRGRRRQAGRAQRRKADNAWDASGGRRFLPPCRVMQHPYPAARIGPPVTNLPDGSHGFPLDGLAPRDRRLRHSVSGLSCSTRCLRSNASHAAASWLDAVFSGKAPGMVFIF